MWLLTCPFWNNLGHKALQKISFSSSTTTWRFIYDADDRQREQSFMNMLTGTNTDVLRMATISIVTPFYNEEQCVAEYYNRVTAAMRESGREYEIIAVSDGSTDKTNDILRDMIQRDRSLRFIRLSRNTGQWAAISAGLSASRGDYVVVMDGDLQHSPEEIHLLIEKMDEGYDLVSGSRTNRTESLLSRRLPSLIANVLLRRVTGCPIRDMGGFKCLRGDIARNLRLRAGQHRLLPALVYVQGGRVGEVYVSAPPRFAGRSKYNLRRSVDTFLDIVMLWFQTSLGFRPMHALGRVGIVFLGLALLSLTWTLLGKFVYETPLLSRPAFFVGLISIVLSFLLFFSAFVLDFMSDIWNREANRLPYIVREMRGSIQDESRPQRERLELRSNDCD
jgi:glycosyltransferase involved in cell wall biosynthesis